MIDALTGMVNSFGYLGIFISTSLEYGCFPVSSEVLLPFIGFFVFGGEMSLFGAILVSTAGGIAGSLVCYCFGRFGRRFIEKTLCSKYSSLKKGLEKAGRVFDKYGSKSVLIARVFPIARTYISIPAGLMGRNVSVFVIYTAVGSFVWNTMLISAGYFLGGYGSLIRGNILFYVIMVLVSIVLIKLSKEMSK